MQNLEDQLREKMEAAAPLENRRMLLRLKGQVTMKKGGRVPVVANKIMDVMQDGKERHVREIAAAAGIKTDSAKDVCLRLANNGLLTRDSIEVERRKLITYRAAQVRAAE